MKRSAAILLTCLIVPDLVRPVDVEDQFQCDRTFDDAAAVWARRPK
jgi:hypothetical protein